MSNLVCGCYVRVSTENQIENYSVDEQIQRLKSYCHAKEITIGDFYVDAGYSGGNTNRPALEKMLNDIENKKINAVVVYKLDRLSRSQRDTLTLIEENFKDVAFISVQENFDTSTPLGKAMIGILSVFAQLEKDQITERFTMGRIGRSKAGYYHGGSTAPFGYHYIDGQLHVNEDEANQIREVFAMFQNGSTMNAILTHMQNQYGGWSGAARIAYTLRNPVYTGHVRFKGVTYKGVHEPIISQSQFDIVQDLITSSEREEKKSSVQKSPFRANYLLTGLVMCGNCGARYSGGHGYYKCYSVSKNSKRFIKDPNCNAPKFKIEVLDDYVISELLNLKYDKALQKELISNAPKTKVVDNEKKIKNIEKQINKLVDLYQFSDMPIEEIKSRIEELKSQKEHLVKNTPVDTSKNIAAFVAALNSLEEVIDSGDLANKRLVIATLVKEVLIINGEISIAWRI